jgi:hypothetical protein
MGPITRALKNALFCHSGLDPESDMADICQEKNSSPVPYFLRVIFPLLIRGIIRDGTSFATFDHSDIRGFDRYDLTSSRSCLGLVAEVRLRPYSLGFLEDSPNVVAPLFMPWIFCVSFFTRSLLRILLFAL